MAISERSGKGRDGNEGSLRGDTEGDAEGQHDDRQRCLVCAESRGEEQEDVSEQTSGRNTAPCGARKVVSGDFDMDRKALERLVSALIDDEDTIGTNRTEAVSNALALAMIALEGDDDFDYVMDRLDKGFLEISIQSLVRMIREKDVTIFRVSEDAPEYGDPINILVTDSPLLTGMVDHSIDRLMDFSENEDPYSVH
jgi:hypothetical protein